MLPLPGWERKGSLWHFEGNPTPGPGPQTLRDLTCPSLQPTVGTLSFVLGSGYTGFLAVLWGEGLWALMCLALPYSLMASSFTS